MKCGHCANGMLSRTQKPDALGRRVEKCDKCPYRRFIIADSEGSEAAPLSGSLVRPQGNGATARTVAPAPKAVTIARPAPVAVAGLPCPTCGRKVKAVRLCHTCKERPALPHKRACSECFVPPGAPKTRYCCECGTRYLYAKGDPPAAKFRCPTHRKKAKAA